MKARSIRAVLCLVGVGLACSAVIAQEGGVASADANIVLTVRIGALDGDDRNVEKTYELILSPGTDGARLLSGARVPIPVTTSAGEDDGEHEVVSSYSYQNIGFSITAEAARTSASDRILLRALLEDSSIAEGTPTDDPPIVETRQLSVNVVLKDGVPLEITRVERLVGESGYVEVQADFMD